MKKAVVLGKGDLAIKISEWFLQSDEYELSCIIPVIPEPLWTNSIVKWSESKNVPIISSGDYGDLDISPDLAMSVFYDKIFKSDFINRCKNIINLHNAPLPKYRGVRPINWALKNNENHHGITIHKIHEGIDDGNILGRITYPIYPEIEEVIDVYKKALEYGFVLFKDVISKIDYCLANSTPQDLTGEMSTYYSNKENHLLCERANFRR